VSIQIAIFYRKFPTLLIAPLGIIGIMATCLVLGLTLYVQQALVVAILMFVFSVLSMLVGMFFYISEVAIGLSSEKEEEQLYELMDVMSESGD
jgi:dolichyl-phosphate-mannose--protein O-mannosyl transferase